MNIKQRLKAKSKAALVRSTLRLNAALWEQSQALLVDDAFLTELERIMGGFPLRSFLPYTF